MLSYFLFSHKFHKIANYFSLEVLKKKIWANFQRIIELFTQKIVTKLSKIWIWDTGSGKNLFRIPDPGVKKAPDPGSGSATLVERLYCVYRDGGVGVGHSPAKQIVHGDERHTVYITLNRLYMKILIFNNQFAKFDRLKKRML